MGGTHSSVTRGLDLRLQTNIAKYNVSKFCFSNRFASFFKNLYPNVFIFVNIPKTINSGYSLLDIVYDVHTGSEAKRQLAITKGKRKGQDTCYSATYMSQTRDQQRFTISEVASDRHEAMVPQRIMWPSIARANGQLDLWCS